MGNDRRNTNRDTASDDDSDPCYRGSSDTARDMKSHGHCANRKRTGTYNSWRAMIERCYYEKHPRYPDYGGRGVSVCLRWQGPGGFDQFLSDMGDRPPDMTLDRIDNDGHYVANNCRWATIGEQRWNRRDMTERVQETPPEHSLVSLHRGLS